MLYSPETSGPLAVGQQVMTVHDLSSPREPGVVFTGFQRLVPVDVTPDGKEGCLYPCKLWLGDSD